MPIRSYKVRENEKKAQNLTLNGRYHARCTKFELALA